MSFGIKCILEKSSELIVEFCAFTWGIIMVMVNSIQHLIRITIYVELKAMHKYLGCLSVQML